MFDVEFINFVKCLQKFEQIILLKHLSQFLPLWNLLLWSICSYDP